ncbi:MAG: GTP cyclohydrolase I, partial [Gemmatimonadaceae bacterium]|nr:GTP cyclohydrolase I [Gemmatimonadaceae bacterium]
MPVSLAPSLPPHVAPPAPRAGLNLADDDRLVRTASAFRAFLETLDLDLDDANLVGTDFRVARAYRELFAGLAPGAEPNLTTFANVEGYADIVSVVGIPFFSVCAHHFIQFFGVAHVW